MFLFTCQNLHGDRGPELPYVLLHLQTDFLCFFLMKQLEPSLPTISAVRQICYSVSREPLGRSSRRRGGVVEWFWIYRISGCGAHGSTLPMPSSGYPKPFWPSHIILKGVQLKGEQDSLLNCISKGVVVVLFINDYGWQY